MIGVPVAHSEASEEGTGGRLRFQALKELPEKYIGMAGAEGLNGTPE